MKTHTTKPWALLFFLCTLFVLGSCKKKEELETINPGMSFIVNGTAKSTLGADNVFATLSSEHTLTVTGKLIPTNELITLVIPAIRNKGEFPITGSAQATYINGSVPAINNYSATSGTIKITTFQSNGVKGTFQFHSVNPSTAIKDITEGAFEAEIKK